MIEILYENNDIVVCVKPVGINSQNNSAEDMVKLLNKQTSGEIFPVHRLDTAVGGVMVFAKNSLTAGELSKQIADRTFKKKYMAVISGVPENEHGVLEDLLFKDSAKNKTFVVKRERRGVKRASLEYKLLSSCSGFSLVDILLHTGRSHQIRVQFASRKMPLVGDGKYGSHENRCSVALWSSELCFCLNEKDFSFFSQPDFKQYPWNLFDKVNN